MGKNKRRITFGGCLINLLLILLLLTGTALVFNDQIKNLVIKWRGDHYAISAVSKDEIDKNQQANATFDFDAVQPVSSEAVLRGALKDKRLPVVGGVSVPSVGINLPVFKGLSNEALLWGAGTLSPEQIMGEGNYALASHRTYEPDLLFTPLDQTQIGAAIYLTDLTNIYTYRAVLNVKVQPTEVKYLDIIDNKKLVTLITCGEVDGITRVIVQGELEKTTPIKEATPEMLEAFQLEQKTY